MKLFTAEASDPKTNAQSNLSGRTHYVDDATLRFHHSRILATGISHDGLLFSLIESISLDMRNTSRGFRYVIFDIFGSVISRVDLDESFSSKAKAQKALTSNLAKVDAREHTLQAIDTAAQRYTREMNELRAKIAEAL